MKTRFLISMITTLLLSVFIAPALADASSIDVGYIVGGLAGASFLPLAPAGSMCAGVLKEIWTGELVKAFRLEGTFLGRIGSRNELVNNNVIHMVDVGADPDVLINNTTYPIAIASREDADIAISLDKFDTENTKVTRDELYAISYDKMASVIEQHKEVLVEKEADKSIHALAPSVNATATPLVMTTGGSNGETAARKRLLPADIVTAKKKLDDLKVPKMNRILVLCNDHIQDLLLVDEKFNLQYKDAREGTILKLYGFEIYEYTNCPIYKVTNQVLTKKAFGAVADSTNDQNASVFFYAPRAFQATGTTEMFYNDASQNPEYRMSVVGFQQYHICLPKKWLGFGCLVSAIYTG